MSTALLTAAATIGGRTQQAEGLERFEALRSGGADRASTMKDMVATIKRASADVRAATAAFKFGLTSTYASEPGTLPAEDRIVMETPAGPVGINRLAHNQLADKLAIPVKYYQRLLEHYPEGVVDHLNFWLSTQPDVRLLRMLRPYNEGMNIRSARMGGVPMFLRAYLADQFRTMDNFEVAGAVMEQAEAQGAFVKEYDISDERFYVRLVQNEPDNVREVIRRMNPAELSAARSLDLPLGFGVSVRNSETGHSLLDVSPYVLIIHCTNGAFGDSLFKRMHVGRKVGQSENWLGNDTRALEDAATFAQVRDAVGAAFTENNRFTISAKIAEAAGTPVALPPSAPLFEFIGALADKADLTEQETGLFQEEFTKEVALHTADGRPTRWTVSQGLTATARRIGEAGDFERKAELERTGWQVLDTSTDTLVKAAQQAVRAIN
jgi:hypothetical protein